MSIMSLKLLKLVAVEDDTWFTTIYDTHCKDYLPEIILNIHMVIDLFLVFLCCRNEVRLV